MKSVSLRIFDLKEANAVRFELEHPGLLPGGGSNVSGNGSDIRHDDADLANSVLPLIRRFRSATTVPNQLDVEVGSSQVDDPEPAVGSSGVVENRAL